MAINNDGPENVDTTEIDIGPWRRHSSRSVYDNPWIHLTHEEVTTPGGSAGIYGKLHFKNLAIGIVALDANGFTWLVGQYRYALDSYSWEIPMGGGPLHVDPLASAQHELAEETGLTANQWQQILTLHTSNSVTDEKGFVFLAQDLSPGEQSLEDSESDIVVSRRPLAEAVAMALSGEITDAISIAGLLATERILHHSA